MSLNSFSSCLYPPSAGVLDLYYQSPILFLWILSFFLQVGSHVSQPGLEVTVELNFSSSNLVGLRACASHLAHSPMEDNKILVALEDFFIKSISRT